MRLTGQYPPVSLAAMIGSCHRRASFSWLVGRLCGTSIAVWIWGGAWAALAWIGAYVLFTVASCLTNGKSDRLLLSLMLLAAATFLANWYFKDWSKTLGLPLAALRYLLAIKAYPWRLPRIIGIMENLLTGQLLSNFNAYEDRQKAKKNKKRPRSWHPAKRKAKKAN